MSLKALALTLLCGTLLVPAAGGQTQRQQIIQLQRDMALVQDSLRQFDTKLSDRLAGLEALQRQNTDKQDKLAAGLTVIERALSSLDDKLTEPQRTTGAKVDSLTEQFSGLRTMVEEMGASIERINGDLRDIKTHLTTLPPPSEGEEGTESDVAEVNASEAIFEGALADYNRGNIESARDLFLDYLALYPTHSRAAEAQLFLAETYFSAAEYEEAAKQFGEVYKKYPLSMQAPDALFRQGMCLLELRSLDEAVEMFESVIERFPGTNPADLSRRELNRLLNTKPSPGL